MSGLSGPNFFRADRDLGFAHSHTCRPDADRLRDTVPPRVAFRILIFSRDELGESPKSSPIQFRTAHRRRAVPPSRPQWVRSALSTQVALSLLLEILELPGENPSPLSGHLLGHCAGVDFLAYPQLLLSRRHGG